MSFIRVSRDFHEIFKDASREFQEYFNIALRELERFFRASGELKGSYKRAIREL